MNEYDLNERNKQRIDLSFYITLAAMALFIGIGRIIMGLPVMGRLPKWLWLLLATWPLQLAYMFCAVYPARKYCPKQSLLNTLELKQTKWKWIVCALFGTLFLTLLLSILNGGWLFLLEFLKISAPEQPIITILRYAPAKVLAVLLPSALILAPVGEELCFRHVIYKKMEAYNGTKAAVIASSLFFAAFHMNLHSFPALAILAFWLIWLYRRSGSLAVCIFAHAVFNTVSVAVILLMRIPGIR